MVTIRVVNRRVCGYAMPVFSSGLKGGRVLLKEDACYLPRGHLGPHRSPSGGILNNPDTFERELEGGK